MRIEKFKNQIVAKKFKFKNQICPLSVTKVETPCKAFKDTFNLSQDCVKGTTNSMTLRTFALIVSAHPYCARKSTCHVMPPRASSARAKC